MPRFLLGTPKRSPQKRKRPMANVGTLYGISDPRATELYYNSECMERLLITVISTVFFFPSFGIAAEFNAGFVEGIWYSTDSLFTGEPTRMYVALRNNTDKDLSGTVQFTDNGTRIGTTFVKALPGAVQEVWIDWTPTYGDHEIAATLIDVKLQAPGESPEQVVVESTLAKDTLFIDLDTDSDNVGNKDDTDDDGDSVSDDDETAAGTDPLVPDTAKKQKEDDDENRRSRPREDRDEKSDDATQNEPATETSAPSREGLERFLGDGAVDSILKKTTDSVSGVKQRLDEYREERNKSLEPEKVLEETNLTMSTSTGTSSVGELATITTTRIEKEKPGLISHLTSGFKAVFAALYTFILWVASGLLAHPAIFELILLILILYFIFKLARRFAARPKEF